MGAASAFSAAAVLVACAFAGATFERWLARRRRHDLAWATSMALFAAGALAYFFGVALGWRPWSFKAFYLLGGVLTVPVLALGTIYLLIGRRWGDRLALATALVGAFASGVIVSAPLRGHVAGDRLDAGREVLGLGPRIPAAVGSGLGATVVIGETLWARGDCGGARWPGPAGDDRATRLAVANLLIAAGTLLVSLEAAVRGAGRLRGDRLRHGALGRAGRRVRRLPGGRRTAPGAAGTHSATSPVASTSAGAFAGAGSAQRSPGRCRAAGLADLLTGSGPAGIAAPGGRPCPRPPGGAGRRTPPWSRHLATTALRAEADDVLLDGLAVEGDGKALTASPSPGGHADHGGTVDAAACRAAPLRPRPGTR